jgi:hypothetical protein
MSKSNRLKSMDSFEKLSFISLNNNESKSIIGASGCHTAIITNCGSSNEDFLNDKCDCPPA